MAIALRGALNDLVGGASNGNNVTLTFDVTTPPLEDDIVVIYGGHSHGVTTLTAPTGNTSGSYILIAEYTGFLPICGVWYQRMGATPDLNVVGSGTANSGDSAAYGSYVLSGVDTTTAQDVTATTAQVDDTTNPNAPSITTVTDGAWVIPIAGSSLVDATPGTVAGYANQNTIAQNDTRDITIAGATFEKVTAGAEDPAAWGTWGTSKWFTVTTAWRPAGAATNAPTGGIYGPLYGPLGGPV